MLAVKGGRACDALATLSVAFRSAVRSSSIPGKSSNGVPIGSGGHLAFLLTKGFIAVDQETCDAVLGADFICFHFRIASLIFIKMPRILSTASEPVWAAWI